MKGDLNSDDVIIVQELQVFKHDDPDLAAFLVLSLVTVSVVKAYMVSKLASAKKVLTIVSAQRSPLRCI